MLDGIRANAQSWGVKAAFGAIILVFVFWGIGSGSTPNAVVAKVNGINITDAEFVRSYRQMEERVRAYYPNMSQEMLQSLGLEQQTLQSLVEQKLLLSEADRTHIDVSPYDLRRLLDSRPEFQGPDGKFSKDVYLSVLKNAGLTASGYEASLRQDILGQKFYSVVAAGAYASPRQARAVFNFEGERRAVNYLFFPAEIHAAEAAPTEEELAAAYAARANAMFMMPPRVRLEYVALDPAALADPAAVTDEAVAAAYAARQDGYALPERVRARHILVLVPENASEQDAAKAREIMESAAQRIKNGEDFAAVAAAVSQDTGSAPQGGDLGWFSRSQMVPEFADAAFALQPGEMSGPVRSPFGYHLIKVEEREAARTRPLEEVRDELRASLAAQAGADIARDKADAVLSAALSGKSLADAAAAAGVAAQASELAAVDSVAQSLGLNPADTETIRTAPAGTVLGRPLAAGNELLVVRVAESLPQMTRPLEEVREDLTVLLTREKSRSLAQADAQKALAAFVDGKPAADMQAEVKRSELFDRQGYVPDLGLNFDLVKDAFARPAAEAGAGKWLPTAYTTDEGAVLVSLAEVSLPDDAAWAEAEPAVLAQLQEREEGMMFGVYQFLLQRSAKIEEFNLSRLQRGAAPQS